LFLKITKKRKRRDCRSYGPRSAGQQKKGVSPGGKGRRRERKGRDRSSSLRPPPQKRREGGKIFTFYFSSVARRRKEERRKAHPSTLLTRLKCSARGGERETSRSMYSLLRRKGEINDQQTAGRNAKKEGSVEIAIIFKNPRVKEEKERAGPAAETSVACRPAYPKGTEKGEERKATIEGRRKGKEEHDTPVLNCPRHASGKKRERKFLSSIALR